MQATAVALEFQEAAINEPLLVVQMPGSSEKRIVSYRLLPSQWRSIRHDRECLAEVILPQHSDLITINAARRVCVMIPGRSPDGSLWVESEDGHISASFAELPPFTRLILL